MLEWLWAARPFLQYGYAALLLLAALSWGAAPERILAFVLGAMLAVDQLYHFVVGGSILWRHADVGHMVIDCVVFATVLPVALRANRVYPLWIGGAQIIALMAHVYRFSLTEIDRTAYDMMAVMPSYIQLTAMTAGLAFHMWRRNRLGSYPSWRDSYTPMPATVPKSLRGG
ncbi:hypothetical protein [Novosphingobium mangrovi (ex Huang et al. 2023)]|uniref:Diguanylate cyclase n=1 Tax=Novosphingobium mangrovi (ex Huang et al. 2023) TaxID=2976432 RepID=A0ABT2I3E8_9SPHN|nr:hypothetical protein [Novosphingobium mangrovi (ex Huang et al. 2023)]MCT2399332.1 hypothetical protein [Novosphingobium mangrovi (ex Huang et al. 2023)]